MDIVLLTIGYPHPNRDVFVENEIKYISENFENVYIIPVIEGKLYPKKNKFNKVKNMPDNVKILNIEYRYFDFFNIDNKLLKECMKDMFLNTKFNFRLILKKFRWYIHSKIVLKNINNLVEKETLVKKKTILYSFWFHFNSMAIACTEGEFALKVSRAHGYDLYEERGIQPCKKFITKELDYIFPCSDLGKKYLIDKYKYKEKFIKSYLGTSNKFNVDIVDNRGKCFNIVSCSSIISIKRLDKIIDALSIIESHNIRWKHIGDGSLAKKIKEYAEKKLGNKKNIEFEFLGNIENNKVLEYYYKNEINLFINVSSTEGLPVSIMEAISFGIPVIATNVGGVREIIDSNKNGYLLNEEFKSSELSNMILKFIEMGSSKYVNMRNESFKKWSNEFNSEKNYEKYFHELKTNANKVNNIGVNL
ncbi:MAG: glycosyltransferase [Paeniclostridium sordellii]|nr:glycosyltransferase [Paeniclostridium sordellii]MBS6025324.1 glycosyltransferase [Paeniclostridium sordellii]CEN94060.1 group 1 glycosyl transferase [[Clostridium] sordellii] [Paeniclostridium sordellii]CEN96062.1 group 1 glycosyl transferase [[Clostridium] sordellii] [Paeniclostridium sordellii]